MNYNIGIFFGLGNHLGFPCNKDSVKNISSHKILYKSFFFFFFELSSQFTLPYLVVLFSKKLQASI